MNKLQNNTFCKKAISFISKDYIFLILLFCIGLLFFPAYGAYLDQNSEQQILYSNVLAYCNELHLAPEFAEYIRSFDIVDIREYIDRDHGMCVFYPMFFIWQIRDTSPASANLIWHLYVYILCFAGIVCLYYLAKDMFGKSNAVFTTLFFFLTPRIFAEIHYNNKDAVILSLTLVAFFLGYKLKKNTTFLNAVLFGIIGAVLSNMKIIGLFLWGIIGLWVLFDRIFNKKFNLSLVLKMLVCFATTGIVFALITPAVWSGPIEYFKYQFESAQNFRWNDNLLFAGNLYSRNITGFSRKYLPVTITMTLPISALLLSVIGMIYIILSLFKKEDRENAFFALSTVLAGLFPVLYAAYTRATVYNGWRHFYFCYASIIIALSFGIKALSTIKKKHIVKITLSSVLVILFLGICINHPYQYTYYNFPARLFVKDNFELDYWDMSIYQALKYLGKTTDGDINVACLDNPSMWGVAAHINNALPDSLTQRINQTYLWQYGESYLDYTDYLIINPTYSAIYSKEQYTQIQAECEMIYQIKSYGNVICEIYKVH